MFAFQTWRLYVIWGRNFTICIIPFIIWMLHCIIASIAVSGFIPATATPLTRNVHSYGLAGWGLETGVNFLASDGIAYRLWHAGFIGRNFFTVSSSLSFILDIERKDRCVAFGRHKEIFRKKLTEGNTKLIGLLQAFHVSPSFSINVLS
ncbi:hypothetical protein F4604DRAFT_1219167 [Suillus subluteus]|nr:hypothetical protein F4604DRAFT_1219167 [Suillus subluteus]